MGEKATAVALQRQLQLPHRQQQYEATAGVAQQEQEGKLRQEYCSDKHSDSSWDDIENSAAFPTCTNLRIKTKGTV